MRQLRLGDRCFLADSQLQLDGHAAARRPSARAVDHHQPDRCERGDDLFRRGGVEAVDLLELLGQIMQDIRQPRELPRHYASDLRDPAARRRQRQIFLVAAVDAVRQLRAFTAPLEKALLNVALRNKAVFLEHRRQAAHIVHGQTALLLPAVDPQPAVFAGLIGGAAEDPVRVLLIQPSEPLGHGIDAGGHILQRLGAVRQPHGDTAPHRL